MSVHQINTMTPSIQTFCESNAHMLSMSTGVFQLMWRVSSSSACPAPATPIYILSALSSGTPVQVSHNPAWRNGHWVDGWKIIHIRKIIIFYSRFTACPLFTESAVQWKLLLIRHSRINNTPLHQISKTLSFINLSLSCTVYQDFMSFSAFFSWNWHLTFSPY